MNKMKKALAIFLSSSMIFAMFSGCSNTAATHSATQTGEKKKIKFSMAVTEQQKADAENAIARFEKKIRIIRWTLILPAVPLGRICATN